MPSSPGLWLEPPDEAPPFRLPLRTLFRTPSTTLWEYWERETSGKRDERGTVRERVND